ncbi:16S rRNA (cytosine(1402)-N(4))-methyltransferase RsmH [Porticoccus sp. W117]|uniref:16S rRNA (cytosine(1402)-N(4))-methyltransferase RsmH n=1 Tax=Porticoccus sp. W117 TaxID=3054777 RepID=UPI002599F812|nr:16S rRNA (cytosine(1402)-N(4))-methyltransferase RsmH [Porticoccus sp. W117]MDM3871746.1 16S rRNA (cytosine(1402)-N(4))-methyltransferase RsmH [Porticoccus sp. W117]
MIQQDQTAHTTVLLDEAVDALVTDPDGTYIDGTFGRGGHSAAILARLSENGRLLAFDKDPEAIASGRKRFADDQRLELIHDSFATLGDQVAQRNLTGSVQGVLLDLGVSSPQLDDDHRGFSFLREGPLDMRMNTESGESAAKWLARAKEDEIAQVLKEYGEERFARRMAKAIVSARQQQDITTTTQLAKIVADAHPAWEKHKHPATRAFQGIRIHINRELDDLKQLLAAVLDVLAVGGRLVAISFHSLEDRIVKRFVRDQERGPQLPRGVPVRDEPDSRRMKSLGKPLKPSGGEVDDNIRSRSAIMRVAEKLA